MNLSARYNPPIKHTEANMNATKPKAVYEVARLTGKSGALLPPLRKAHIKKAALGSAPRICHMNRINRMARR